MLENLVLRSVLLMEQLVLSVQLVPLHYLLASILSQASYDNVSFSVASQDTIPFGMVFNTDGS